MSDQFDLYQISIGATNWRFTNAPVDKTYLANTYTSTALKRSNIESKRDMAKANLTIEIPLSHALSVQLLSSFTEQVVSLTIFTSRDGSVNATWKGRLVAIKPGDTLLSLIFESIFTSMQRSGLRARYQLQCRHALYSRGCGIDAEDFGVAGTVTGLTGNTITVTEAASQANGYYLGGMIEAANGIKSFIIGHSGSTLTVQRTSAALREQWADEGSGTQVTIYPGCDLSRQTCASRFNNGLNYGGFDWIPQKNPMGGSSIV